MSFIVNGIAGTQHKGWQPIQQQTVRPETKRINGDNTAVAHEPKT